MMSHINVLTEIMDVEGTMCSNIDDEIIVGGCGGSAETIDIGNPYLNTLVNTLVNLMLFVLYTIIMIGIVCQFN